MRNAIIAIVALAGVLILVGLSVGGFKPVGQNSHADTQFTSTGETLLRFSGSGTGPSEPFTASTSSVRVEITITPIASLTHPGYTWYIYRVGASSYTCQGERSAQMGSYVDYCSGLTVGADYYVEVFAHDCSWQTEITAVS